MTMIDDQLAIKEATIKELQEENRILKLQLEGNIPDATFWLYRKVYRQKDALNKLNRRVVTQRFILRTLEELGRGLTHEEYTTARDNPSNDNVRNRIEEAA